MYVDWSKWRDEWVRRRKVFYVYVVRILSNGLISALFNGTGGVFIQFICSRFWQLVVDPLPPQDAKNLEEHLGIERDTSEHAALEQGSLCQQKRKF